MRVIGTVPVESDGSAHFTVPVDQAVYFQALDADYREVRRMRSHVTFQPGEVRGCTGCHESQPRTPQERWRAPRALGHDPRPPEPPSWGTQRLLGYEWMIQPIFQRRCVRCHGESDPDGGVDLSAAVADDGFMRSFHTLFGHSPDGTPAAPALVAVADRFSGAAVSQPGAFGSRRSRLVEVLGDPLHRREAGLERDEWIALVTWVDANAPYHDKFYNRRPPDGVPRRDVASTSAAGRAAD